MPIVHFWSTHSPPQQDWRRPTVANMPELVLIPMTFIPPFQGDFVYDSIIKISLEAFILAIPKHSFCLTKMLVFLWGVVYKLDINFG